MRFFYNVLFCLIRIKHQRQIKKQGLPILNTKLYPTKMGYDEIIVILPISATSKGFSVYHYPIAFSTGTGITKQNAFCMRLHFFHGRSKASGADIEARLA